MRFQPPSFIAFTGVDRAALRPGLAELAARYPIEWGILIDDQRPPDPLFPDAPTRAALLEGTPLRWAAHVCGRAAQAIAAGRGGALPGLAGFTRLQVNHGFHGSDDQQVGAVSRFGQQHGLRTVLQCLSSFPDDPRVDWLFDVSFGRGSRPAMWPALPAAEPFCGFSGGINADNVRETLELIAAPPGAAYWIDMESGVRTDGLFDLGKCAAVCRAVYG